MYVRHTFGMQLIFGKDRVFYLFMVKIAQGSETSATLLKGGLGDLEDVHTFVLERQPGS